MIFNECATNDSRESRVTPSTNIDIPNILRAQTLYTYVMNVANLTCNVNLMARILRDL